MIYVYIVQIIKFLYQLISFLIACFQQQVTVETLEKGFLINVCCGRSCPGLLVSILEAFEDLGLNVLEARVSCTESFRLQAVGGEDVRN